MGYVLKLNGKEVTREEFLANARGITPGAVQRVGDRFRKIESESFGIHPDQLQEATAYNAANGLTGVSYDAEGNATFNSRKALERMAKHYDLRIGKKELDHGRRR